MVIMVLLLLENSFALPPSKYRNRDAVNLEAIVFGGEATEFNMESDTSATVDIFWKTKMESNTVSTPIIADLFQDGRKQVVVTGFNFIDVISATDGRRLPGFPFTFGWTTIIADPILYDIDEDGYEEILVSTMSGEMVFVNRWGELVPGRTLKIPKLRVPKNWYEGLETTTTYFSLVDVSRYEHISTVKPHHEKGDGGGATSPKAAERKVYKGTSTKVNPNKNAGDLRTPSIEYSRQGTGKRAWSGFEGWLTDEGLDSLQLFLDSRPLTETEEMNALFSPQYAHWIQSHPDHHQFPDSSDIFVDAHIYNAPILADLDGDGGLDLIVAVNYYFDDSITSKPGRVAKYPVNTDFTKYIACGVVVFSMESEQISWISPLELTTDSSQYLARTYASPTVADLDNDGKLDIIVGTAVGSVYVLKSDGTWNPKLANINTDTIGAPVLAADVTGDGKMNVLVVDDGGTIVCFEADGTEIWENRVSSSVNHAPILGDVNGDGILDVVVVAVVGHVWAFSGKDGKVIPNFPVKLASISNAAPLLLPLSPIGLQRDWISTVDGLTIVVHGNDGIIYMIDAKQGLVDKLDIGETSMGMILADDLTGNGFIDLLITTSEGHVYCLSTGHPLVSTSATWKSLRDGRNSFTTGVYQGIRVNEATKLRHHVSGKYFTFSFEIIDERPALGPNARYQITLWHGANRWFSQTYYHKGLHVATIRAPAEVMTATLKLELVNEHGQAFFDSWNVGFNLNWYRTLKWLLALPVIFMSTAILFAKDVVNFLP